MVKHSFFMFRHYNQQMQNRTVVAYMITWNLRTQRWRCRSPHGSRQKCVQYGRLLLLLGLTLKMWTHMLISLHHIEHHHWKNGKSLEIWKSSIWYVGLMGWWVDGTIVPPSDDPIFISDRLGIILWDRPI